MIINGSEILSHFGNEVVVVNIFAISPIVLLFVAGLSILVGTLMNKNIFTEPPSWDLPMYSFFRKNKTVYKAYWIFTGVGMIVLSFVFVYLITS